MRKIFFCFCTLSVFLYRSDSDITLIYVYFCGCLSYLFNCKTLQSKGGDFLTPTKSEINFIVNRQVESTIQKYGYNSFEMQHPYQIRDFEHGRQMQ